MEKDNKSCDKNKKKGIISRLIKTTGILYVITKINYNKIKEDAKMIYFFIYKFYEIHKKNNHSNITIVFSFIGITLLLLINVILGSFIFTGIKIYDIFQKIFKL
jgi:hypothetical protein